MTADRPAPPDDLERELDPELLEALESHDPETLRAVGRYVDELASWKEHTQGDDLEGLEYPADVPDRASVTVTEIDGTEYLYYQWREGDEIRSKTETR